MRFAINIKELREEKNLSQEQLAKLTGISQSAIAKWELSKAEPTASMLIALAQFFDLTVGQLLGVEEI
ncbi:MAG: helix-turn-helix transcriptional regulator [Firmicutes bacterium]|nr:helix-turn-helix transcriptional regulator [Bacillota bacterium]